MFQSFVDESAPPEGVSSDKVDWGMLTPWARKAVESALKPRKAEWLVIDGKPVPGVKEKVWEGGWDMDHDGSEGWAALPDTVEKPKMKDGTMLEWTNVNTKLPHEEGFLEARFARVLHSAHPPSRELRSWTWSRRKGVRAT